MCSSTASPPSTAPDDVTLVVAMVSMGHSLKLRVVAEGVETQEELAFLQSNQCAEAQGYYFSPPIHPDQFAQLLATRYNGLSIN